MVRTLRPAPAGLMGFRVRVAMVVRIRLIMEMESLADTVQSLRTAGRTDAEIAANGKVAKARGGVVETYTRVVRAVGESIPALCILLPR